MCGRTDEFKAAPKGTKAWPTSCCCEHTHTCVANTPTVGGYKGLADQLLLRACKPQNKSIRGCLQSKGFSGLADQAWLGAYTRVLQNLSVQSCTYGPWVTRIWQTNCYCERTHEHVHCRIILRKSCRPSATASRHMCVAESRLGVAPKDQGLQGLGRPTASVSIHMCVCCKHTHVCCGMIKRGVSPKDQRLQRFRRPLAPAGTHMCD